MVGFLLPAVALVGASFTGCDRIATVALVYVSFSDFIKHIEVTDPFDHRLRLPLASTELFTQDIRCAQVYANRVTFKTDSSLQINHIDVASNYAGVLMGITNCVANICGFLAPYVVSLVVTHTVTLTDCILRRISTNCGFYYAI